MERTRILPRSLQISFALGAFAWAWFRLHRKAPQQLPGRLRAMLEQLGTTFVKLGQGLSLRRDVLPPGYREELERLQKDLKKQKTAELVPVTKSEFVDEIEKTFTLTDVGKAV